MSANNIQDLIKELANNKDSEIYSELCTVKNINDNDTIDATPVNGKADILGVKLIAEADATNMKIIPVLDSICIVTFLDSSNAYASMFSKIESITIRGDQYGGLVKWPELKDQLDILTDRVDAIYSAIENAVPVADYSGAGLQASIVVGLSSQVQKESFLDLENGNVKHG